MKKKNNQKGTDRLQLTAALFFSVVSPGIVKAEENKDVVENVQEEVISENDQIQKRETGEGAVEPSEIKKEENRVFG